MRAARLLVLALVAACGGGEGMNNDVANDPECSDGADNDGDGAIDFPDDPGCTGDVDTSENSPAQAKCADGRDNDGDAKIDFPNDPGCFAIQGDDESDTCPDGATCPECSNGRDDDGNGSMDYPNDPGCESAADSVEFGANPVACGAGLEIKQLPPSGVDTQTLVNTSTSSLISPCGGGGGAPGYAYLLRLSQPKIVMISTDNPGTTADTVIDLRGEACDQGTAHIACSDDIDTGNQKSKLVRALDPGTYYIIVEGHDTSAVGNYELSVKLFAGQGAECTAPEDCGPGLVCREPNGGGTQKICQAPMCSDAFDNDGDGKMDHPAEPGCSSTVDNDEADTCPGVGEPGCPECADGADNDVDGKIDYPMDTSCKAAGDSSEACVTTEPIEVIVTPTTAGSTLDATHDFDPACNSSSSPAVGDRMYRLDLPTMQTISLNLTGLSSGFDSVTTLLDKSCGGTAIKCSDPAAMTVTNLPGGTYYFVVDGWSTNDVGTYNLTVSGTIAVGGSCETPLFAAGAFTCASGYTCDGPTGERTCRSQCSDKTDNNGDGKIDYPNDPGCSGPSDNMEDTVCPGANCPACANGADDDTDNRTDFPADFGCASAGATTEQFCGTEPNYGGAITLPQTAGSLATVADNGDQTCQTNTGNDVAYSLSLPVPVVSLVIDTEGSVITDTVLAFKDASCGTQLNCDDDSGTGNLSKITASSVAAGNYAIIVDGYGTNNNGAYKLNVKGTVAPQTACNHPLFTAGVLVCPGGTTCTGNRCQ